MRLFSFNMERKQHEQEVDKKEEAKVEEIQPELGNEEKKDLLEFEDSEEEKEQSQKEGLFGSVSSFFSGLGGFFRKKKAPLRETSNKKGSWKKFFGVAADMLSIKRTEEGEENIYKQEDQSRKEVNPYDLTQYFGVKVGKKEVDVRAEARNLIGKVENGSEIENKTSFLGEAGKSMLNRGKSIAGKTWFLAKMFVAGKNQVELSDIDYKRIIKLRKPLGILRRNRTTSIVSEDVGINFLNINLDKGSKLQIDFDSKQEEQSVKLTNGNLNNVNVFGFTVNAKNLTYDSKAEGLKCEEASFIKAGILGEEGVLRGKFKNVIINSKDKLKFDEAEGKVSNAKLGENIELESFNVSSNKLDENKGFVFEAKDITGNYANDDSHVYGSLDNMSFKFSRNENDKKAKVDNAIIKDFNVSTSVIDLDIKNARYTHNPFSISADKIGVTLGANLKKPANESEEEEQKSLFSLNKGSFLDYINLNGFTVKLTNLLINEEKVKFDVGLSLEKIIIDMSYFRSTINIADDTYNLKLKEISFPAPKDDDSKAWFSPETPEIMLYPGIFLYAGAAMGGGLSIEGELEGSKKNKGWNLKGDIDSQAGFFVDVHAGVGIGSQLIAAIKGEIFAKSNIGFKTNIGSELMGVRIERDGSNKKKLRYDNLKFIYDVGFDFTAAVGARFKAQAFKVFDKTLYTIEFKDWNFAKVNLTGEMEKDQGGEFNKTIVKDQVQFIWKKEPPVEDTEPVKDAVRMRNKLLEAGVIYMADEGQENPRKKLGEEAEELEDELVKYLQETRARLDQAKNDLGKRTKKESKVFVKADKHIDKHQERLDSLKQTKDLVESLRDDTDISLGSEGDIEKYKALIANIFSKSNVEEAEKSLKKSQGQYTMQQLYEKTKEVTERKSTGAWSRSGKEKNRSRLDVLESNKQRDRSITFSEENLREMFSKNALNRAMEGMDTSTDLDDEFSKYEYRKTILENIIRHTEEREEFYKTRKNKSLAILKALEDKCSFFQDEENESSNILNNIREAVATPIILQEGQSIYMDAIGKGLEKERRSKAEDEENQGVEEKAKADRIIEEMEKEAEIEEANDMIEEQERRDKEAS